MVAQGPILEKFYVFVTRYIGTMERKRKNEKRLIMA